MATVLPTPLARPARRADALASRGREPALGVESTGRKMSVPERMFLETAERPASRERPAATRRGCPAGPASL